MIGPDDVLTYSQIAYDWDLWKTYVDPDANMTEEEFDAMSIEERVAAMTYMWGVECCEGEEEKEFDAMSIEEAETILKLMRPGGSGAETPSGE